VKQQKLTSVGHSINPLSEAGVLQRILGYVGPDYWLLMSLVSPGWRESYLQVPELQMIGHDADTEHVEFTCVARMMLLRAATTSASVMKLACDCGLPLDSSTLQYIAGRYSDIATLSVAFECGMQRSPDVCDGAARGGCLAELEWLIGDQKCPLRADISVRAAASGSILTLNFLKHGGFSFTETTALSAAAEGHQHVIEYLHAEGCPFDSSTYFLAAAGGHVHVLQRLRELGCAWDSAELCTLAASRGLLPVLQWLRQQGAVFTEGDMVQAAMSGHTAVCEHLHTQQCSFDATACTVAVQRCQLGTLQWLLEHGCPYQTDVMWVVAARQGHIAILSYLQQVPLEASPQALPVALFQAGTSSQLAAAQWLRAQGA
jgi:hypothetical protein